MSFAKHTLKIIFYFFLIFYFKNLTALVFLYKCLKTVGGE